MYFFFFSSRRRHTRFDCDWSSDVCSSDLTVRNAVRCGVGCKQVEFTIPERAHGRHVGELVRVVERAPVSDWVKERAVRAFQDRKSTRLNSSHSQISYAVFCLKKKKQAHYNLV